MRRKDREITDINEIIGIMKKCGVCRLALFDEEYPYIVPLNFGMSDENDSICLYFHGASSGKKLDLIKKCGKASFEMDCGHNLITGERACDYTMEYESVCGSGTVEILNDSEKAAALTLLMNQYDKKESHEFDENEIKAVTVFKLNAENITGKRLAFKK